MSWRTKRFSSVRKVLHISSGRKKQRFEICDSPRSGTLCSSLPVVRNVILTCRHYRVQHVAVPFLLFQEYRLRMHSFQHAARYCTCVAILGDCYRRKNDLPKAVNCCTFPLVVTNIVLIRTTYKVQESSVGTSSSKEQLTKSNKIVKMTVLLYTAA